MIIAPPHHREQERLRALRSYQILDTEPEIGYEDIVAIASSICDVPIALVSLVDEDRQWFKARIGVDASETPRDIAFCGHAILQHGVMEIPNALEDERFHDNPLVSAEPHIRFYAGTSLMDPDGLPLGTLCVIDHKPRRLTEEQRLALNALGRQVMSQLELRAMVRRLNRATDDLSRSNQDLEGFASVASHDLQEPIRKMRIFVDRLHRNWGEDMPPQAGQDLKRLATVAGRMQHLVLDLLNLSRLKSQVEPLSIVNLESTAQEAVQELESRIEESGASIEIRALPTVSGDPVLLRQLLINVIGNAIKFCREDVEPHVEVSATTESTNDRLPPEQGPICHLVIRDNGIGFEEQYAEKIFGVLQRLHGRSQYEGSGIGLALCRRIAEHHGGVIWAESPEESGATIRVLLPVTPSQEHASDLVRAA